MFVKSQNRFMKMQKNSVLTNNNYLVERNPNIDFINGKGKSTLDKHAQKHGYIYSKKIESFVSNEGTYFRYDLETNVFGIINKYGGISTYFKPDNGLEYWIEQIYKYGGN